MAASLPLFSPMTSLSRLSPPCRAVSTSPFALSNSFSSSLTLLRDKLFSVSNARSLACSVASVCGTVPFTISSCPTDVRAPTHRPIHLQYPYSYQDCHIPHLWRGFPAIPSSP